MSLIDKLQYDPTIPEGLRWKVKPAWSVCTGDPAGSLYGCGYYAIKTTKCREYNHRLIWMMFHGDIPKDKIVDHKNRIRTDNRIDNLRLASKSESQCNRVKQVNNRSGYKGVAMMRDGRFKAEIAKHGVRYRLGIFTSAKEAGEAYMTAAKVLHKTFASDGVGGSPDPRSSKES